MQHLLLTGAGFSRNWGGWLASEAFEYLLGAPELNDHLRSLLWQTKRFEGGFEDTLANLQNAFVSDPTAENQSHLNAMTAAVLGMFDAMNASFAKKNLELSDNEHHIFKTFLSKFDAIFTLNQDTLLETHYLGEVRWGKTWEGSYLPYMDEIRPRPGLYAFRLAAPMKPGVKSSVRDDRQPYKLHGSCNWFLEPSGQRLLVMGANKTASIAAYDVLARYQRDFARYLSVPDTRLMVIGYSFGDSHINSVIETAISQHGLKLFIVDPAGVDVLLRRSPAEEPIDAAPIQDRYVSGIIGATRRPLSSIFSGDWTEHEKLMNFFDEASIRTRIQSS